MVWTGTGRDLHLLCLALVRLLYLPTGSLAHSWAKCSSFFSSQGGLLQTAGFSFSHRYIVLQFVVIEGQFRIIQASLCPTRCSIATPTHNQAFSMFHSRYSLLWKLHVFLCEHRADMTFQNVSFFVHLSHYPSVKYVVDFLLVATSSEIGHTPMYLLRWTLATGLYTWLACRLCYRHFWL